MNNILLQYQDKIAFFYAQETPLERWLISPHHSKFCWNVRFTNRALFSMVCGDIFTTTSSEFSPKRNTIYSAAEIYLKPIILLISFVLLISSFLVSSLLFSSHFFYSILVSSILVSSILFSSILVSSHLSSYSSLSFLFLCIIFFYFFLLYLS